MATPRKAAASKKAADTTPDAGDGVTKLADVLGDETGPSDDSKAIGMVSADGTKVTVEERLVDTLKGQGFKRA